MSRDIVQRMNDSIARLAATGVKPRAWVVKPDDLAARFAEMGITGQPRMYEVSREGLTEEGFGEMFTQYYADTPIGSPKKLLSTSNEGNLCPPLDPWWCEE